MGFRLLSEFLTSHLERVAIDTMRLNFGRAAIFLGVLVFEVAARAGISLGYQGDFFTPVSATDSALVLGMTSSSSSCTGFLCDSCAGSGFVFSKNAVCSLKEVHASDDLTVVVTNKGNVGFEKGCFYYSLKGTWVQVTSGYTLLANSGTILLNMGKVICPLVVSGTGIGGNSCAGSGRGTLSIGWTASPCSGTPTTTASTPISFRYVDNSSGSGGANTDVAWGCQGGSLSTDYEGVCHFNSFPGDGKIFIDTLKVNPNNASLNVPDLSSTGTHLPSSYKADGSGIYYSHLMIFTSPEGTPFTTASDSAVLQILGNRNIFPESVSGVVNGTTYNLGMAMVDQAGIVTYFADTGEKVIPAPVYGVLNGQQCFIATAAYGSSMAPQVELFRKFRDRYMLTNKIGRGIAGFYYEHSPPLADLIASSESLKLLSRALLWPVLILVWISLAAGFEVGALSFGFLVLLMGGVSFLWKRRRSGMRSRRVL